MLRRIINVSLFLCAFFVVQQAHAADRYWIGRANSNSDRWESTSNWSANPRGQTCSCVPTSSDTAIFSFSGNTVRIRSAINVAGILMSNVWTGSVLQGTGTIKVGTSGIRVGSGTFVGGNAFVMDAGNLTQTGGIVRGLQNTLSMSGNLVLTTAGVFTSTGTLIFSGNAAQTVTATAPQITFTSLQLRNSGGAGSNTLNLNNCSHNGSGICVIGKNLTITNGTLSQTATSILYLSDGNLTVANNSDAAYSVSQALFISGSIVVNASGTFSQTGETHFFGTGTNTVDTNNNPFGTVVIEDGANITFASDNSVTSYIELDGSSTLSLSTYTLYATGATIVNAGTISEGTGKIVHTGTALITNDGGAETNSFARGGTVYFQVTDTDGNLHGSSLDTLSVNVTLSSGDAEVVTLTETAVASGIFRGSIASSTAARSIGNGTLEVESGAPSMLLTYVDQQDLLSSNDSAAFEATTTSTSSTTGHTGGGGGGRRSLGGGGGSSTPKTTTTSSATVQTSAQLPRSCTVIQKRLEKLAPTVRARALKRTAKKCGW